VSLPIGFALSEQDLGDGLTAAHAGLKASTMASACLATQGMHSGLQLISTTTIGVPRLLHGLGQRAAGRP
jgi:hypothetical protein